MPMEVKSCALAPPTQEGRKKLMNRDPSISLNGMHSASQMSDVFQSHAFQSFGRFITISCMHVYSTCIYELKILLASVLFTLGEGAEKQDKKLACAEEVLLF
jgi:hypothetical protein